MKWFKSLLNSDKFHWLWVLLTGICFANVIWNTKSEKSLLPSSCKMQWEEKLEESSLRIKKIKIENHTYFYIVNSWSHAGNAFVHDPSCEYCKKEG